MQSKIERGFMPLSKVESEQPAPNIKIALSLPGYVDGDRIGVDVKGIVRLCELSGIRGIAVAGITEGKTSHVIPEVSGLNSDGSATASKKIAKVSVPTFEQMRLNFPHTHSRIADRWVWLYIGMNIDEIGLRVSETPKGVHCVDEWAKQLDKGFRVPIRRAGNRNLLYELEAGDKVDYGFIGSYTGLASGTALLINGKVGLDFILALSGGIITNGIASLFLSRRDPLHRFSVLPGPQIDRAVVFNVLSRTKTLIKDLQ